MNIFRALLLCITSTILWTTTVAITPDDLDTYLTVLKRVETPEQACLVLQGIADDAKMVMPDYECNLRPNPVTWQKFLNAIPKVTNDNGIDALFKTLETTRKEADKTRSSKPLKASTDALYDLYTKVESVAKGYVDDIVSLNTPIPEEEEGFLTRMGTKTKEKANQYYDKAKEFACQHGINTPACKVRRNAFLKELASVNEGLALYLVDHPQLEGPAMIVFGFYRAMRLRDGLMVDLLNGYRYVAKGLGFPPAVLSVIIICLVYLFRENLYTPFLLIVGTVGFGWVATMMAVTRTFAKIVSMDRSNVAALTMFSGTIGSMIAQQWQQLTIHQTAMCILTALLMGYIISTIKDSANWRNITLATLAVIAIYTTGDRITLDTLYNTWIKLDTVAQNTIPTKESTIGYFSEVYGGLTNLVQPKETPEKSFRDKSIGFLSERLYGLNVSIWTLAGLSAALSAVATTVYISTIGSRAYACGRDYNANKDHQGRIFNMDIGVGDYILGLGHRSVIVVIAAYLVPCVIVAETLPAALLTILSGIVGGVAVYHTFIHPRLIELGRSAGVTPMRVLGSDYARIAGKMVPSNMYGMYMTIQRTLLIIAATCGCATWIPFPHACFTAALIQLVCYKQAIHVGDIIILVVAVTLGSWGALPHAIAAGMILYVQRMGVIGFDLEALAINENLSFAMNHPG